MVIRDVTMAVTTLAAVILRAKLRGKLDSQHSFTTPGPCTARMLFRVRPSSLEIGLTLSRSQES